MLKMKKTFLHPKNPISKDFYDFQKAILRCRLVCFKTNNSNLCLFPDLNVRIFDSEQVKNFVFNWTGCPTKTLEIYNKFLRTFK